MPTYNKGKISGVHDRVLMILTQLTNASDRQLYSLGTKHAYARTQKDNTKRKMRRPPRTIKGCVIHSWNKNLHGKEAIDTGIQMRKGGIANGKRSEKSLYVYFWNGRGESHYTLACWGLLLNGVQMAYRRADGAITLAESLLLMVWRACTEIKRLQRWN